MSVSEGSIMNKLFSISFVGLMVVLISGCTSKKDRINENTITIAVDSSSSTVHTGSTLNFTAICKNSSSDNLDIAPTWSAENNLGTFSPTKGKTTTFTAGSTEGTGKIYASYYDVSGNKTIGIYGDVPPPPSPQTIHFSGNIITAIPFFLENLQNALIIQLVQFTQK
jgi:hypothetical protein